MDDQVLLWTVSAAGVLALVGLFIVMIARGMDGTAKAKAHGATGAAGEATPDVGAVLKTIRGVRAGDKAVVAAGTKTTAKQTVAAMSSVAVGLAVIGAVTAFLKDNGSGVPLNREISAGELRGTYLSPSDNAEVVLIVPGSGPTDRNGDNPLGIKANSYRLLAEGLFGKGIATVRVDKRGMFASSAAGDPNAVTVEAYAADYHAWIDAIRAETGRKCVWLLGHSEGALMVSAAAEGRKDVCGLILVSGPGRKLGDVLREQLQANPANAPMLPEALTAISALEAGQHIDVSAMHPALMQLFAPQVQDFLISMLAVDPVELLDRSRVQKLIVQGTTDLQVTVEDARRLNKARRTKLELIKGMNHVLKEAPEDRAANFATYSQPDLPLAKGLIGDIADFIEDED